MTPSVSIVVPAYNNADFIEATMRSILEQTHTDFELIVADHSSTDNTMELLRQFESDPRVRVVSTPAGGGALRNWTRVTEEAQGEFLKLVCGDDLIYPDCVQKQVNAFEPGVDMVAARRDVVDAAGRPFMKGRGLTGVIGRVRGLKAIRRTVKAGTNLFGEPASVMFRREALARAGGWDKTESYLIDQATYASVLVGGDFVGLPDSLGAFRLSNSQWSFRLADSQAEEAVAYHGRFAAEHPGVLSRFDLIIGNARARLHARARRIIYLILARQMSRGER